MVLILHIFVFQIDKDMNLTFLGISCARLLSIYSRSSCESLGSSAGESFTTNNHTIDHSTPAAPGKYVFLYENYESQNIATPESKLL